MRGQGLTNKWSGLESQVHTAPHHDLARLCIGDEVFFALVFAAKWRGMGMGGESKEGRGEKGGGEGEGKKGNGEVEGEGRVSREKGRRVGGRVRKIYGALMSIHVAKKMMVQVKRSTTRVFISYKTVVTDEDPRGRNVLLEPSL